MKKLWQKLQRTIKHSSGIRTAHFCGSGGSSLTGLPGLGDLVWRVWSVVWSEGSGLRGVWSEGVWSEGVSGTGWRRGYLVMGRGVWSGVVWFLGDMTLPSPVNRQTCGKKHYLSQLCLLQNANAEFQVILISCTYAKFSLLALKAFRKINMLVKKNDKRTWCSQYLKSQRLITLFYCLTDSSFYSDLLHLNFHGLSADFKYCPQVWVCFMRKKIVVLMMRNKALRMED